MRYSVLLKLTEEMLDLSDILQGDVEQYVKYYLKTGDLSSFLIRYSQNLEDLIYTIRVDSNLPYPGLFPCAEAQIPPQKAATWEHN